MNFRVVFVGGPLDGTAQVHNGQPRPYWEAIEDELEPVLPVDAMMIEAQAQGYARMYKRVFYRLHRWQCDGTEFYFYILNNMSQTEAFKRVVDHYATKRRK